MNEKNLGLLGFEYLMYFRRFEEEFPNFVPLHEDHATTIIGFEVILTDKISTSGNKSPIYLIVKKMIKKGVTGEERQEFSIHSWKAPDALKLIEQIIGRSSNLIGGDSARFFLTNLFWWWVQRS